MKISQLLNTDIDILDALKLVGFEPEFYLKAQYKMIKDKTSYTWNGDNSLKNWIFRLQEGWWVQGHINQGNKPELRALIRVLNKYWDAKLKIHKKQMIIKK